MSNALILVLYLAVFVFNMRWICILPLLIYILPILAAEPFVVPKPEEPTSPNTEPNGGSGDEPGESSGTQGDHPCAGTECSTGGFGDPGPESESPLLEDLGEHLEDIVDFIANLVGTAAATSTKAASSSPYSLAITAKATITPTPTSFPSGALACLSAASLYNSCASSRSPGFSALPTSSQASCLCYTTQNNNASTPTSIFLPYMGDCYIYVDTQPTLQNQTDDIQYAAFMCSNVKYDKEHSSTAVASPTSQRVPPSTNRGMRVVILSHESLLFAVVGLWLGFYVS